MSMAVRLEQIIKRIEDIERDIAGLQQLKSRIPAGRPFTDSISVSFERSISELLTEKISMEELEIETPPEDIVQDVFSVDVATASRIRVDHQTKPTGEPTKSEKKIINFLQSLPKTEIHLHMEACISRLTLQDMLEKNRIEFDEKEIEKLYKFSNLQEFIKLYLFILDAIKTPDDFNLIFTNLRSYLKANNISYAEVFLAPSRLLANGLDFNEICQELDRLTGATLLAGGPEIKVMMDVSRTFGPENADKNLQRVIRAKANSVIGIGLGGAELMGPARDFQDVFARARAEGLHAVAHAGEDDGPWSVRDTVNLLKAERIGHGTSAIQDPALMELLRETGTPIEICLTSNIYTGKYVRSEKDHPVRRYYDEGIVCCINTDDPEIFNVSLTDEYFKLHKHLDFSISELIDLIRQGVYASFHAHPDKLWQGMKSEIELLRKEHDI